MLAARQHIVVSLAVLVVLALLPASHSMQHLLNIQQTLGLDQHQQAHAVNSIGQHAGQHSIQAQQLDEQGKVVPQYNRPRTDAATLENMKRLNAQLLSSGDAGGSAGSEAGQTLTVGTTAASSGQVSGGTTKPDETVLGTARAAAGNVQ